MIPMTMSQGLAACPLRQDSDGARVYSAEVLAAACKESQTKKSKTIEDSIQFICCSSEFVPIENIPNIVVDLKYASTDNFTGQNLYGKFNQAYLHKEAAKKLARAAELLSQKHPKLKFVIFDALRPRSVQKVLFKKVEGTDKQRYVANPSKGSIHNYGFALDLSIVDEKNKPLDMGTTFDDFTELSQPRLEGDFLRQDKLKKPHIENRQLLRQIMEEAGFIQLPDEWWHFDALPGSDIRSKTSKYKIVE